jgi:phosphopantothenoylcysteine decarboxylase/phosphopantothenate--cysteine ligase
VLKGKKILIGVTGSIAAYKSAILIRLLVKKGAEVKVLMTPLAREFITPLTLAALAKNPVLIDFYNAGNGEWNSHIDLGLWADAYVIAPATANTIAKMAYGVADNLLLTTYLSVRCPVFIAPAMDVDMLNHPATQRNISLLSQAGNIILEPASGELASGLEGKGRMEEPERIIEVLEQSLDKPASKKKTL